MTKPPYKSSQGQWYKRALFQDIVSELAIEDRAAIAPIFTLHEERPGFICARKTFVEERDPTGRAWALKYLGDWNHWLALMKCKWFVEAYESWLEELETVLKFEALEKIREIAAGDSSQALAAAKYLANAEYNRQPSARGRPSKEELAGAIKRSVQEAAVEDEDLARIGGLKIITGGKK